MPVSSMKIMSYMKSQIPTFGLTTWLMLTKYVFDDTCDRAYDYLIPICFFIVFGLTGVYEYFYARNIYINKKCKSISLGWYLTMKIASTLLAFITTIYYIFDGKPFNCLFPYSIEVSNASFFLSFIIIFVIGYIEKSLIDKPKNALIQLHNHVTQVV
jgi:hypothetical protein